jgi:hypothetical protein
MKNALFDPRRRKLLLALPPLLASCGGGGSGGTGTSSSAGSNAGGGTPAASGVTVTPVTATLPKGDGMTVKATATAAAGSTLSYHWTVTGDPAVVIAESPPVPGGKTGLAFDTDHAAVDITTASSTVGPLTVTVEAFSVVGTTKTSLGAAQCQVTMVDGQTTLEPATASIELVNGSQVFTLVSTPALTPPPQGLQYKYDWTCASAFGTLTSGGASTSPSGHTITSGSASANYNGNSGLSGGESETITCQAYYLIPQSSPFPAERVDVAKASATVQFKQLFNISLTPVSSDVPTDYDFPIIASIDEALPPGTQVTWKWLGGGIGTLTPAGNDADSRFSNATFKSSAEGIGFATVSADVTPPGGPTTPVLPQTATLKAKKGLTTLVLHPPQGIFACTDPKACGVSAYNAFIVPVMPKAKKYVATFSGFGYGQCNRDQEWTAPVQDHGGCLFPITYHPHNSVGPTNAWAVWIGFGGTPDPTGTCVVTITLGP